MSRPFLITTFRCAACGGPLGLVYPKEMPEAAVKAANAFGMGELHDPQIERIEEPTGADQVGLTVYITPCYTCQQPLRDLQSGVAKLRKVLKDDK